MKVKDKTVIPVETFKPITLEITIESREELLGLHYLFGNTTRARSNGSDLIFYFLDEKLSKLEGKS